MPGKVYQMLFIFFTVTKSREIVTKIDKWQQFHDVIVAES